MSSLGLDTTAKMLADLLWSRFVGDIGKTDRYLCDSTPTPVWSSAPLTEQVVADHVLGRKRIGVGQVGSTLFGVLDFDGKVKDADGKSVLDPVRVEEAWTNTRGVAGLFKRHGFAVLVEVSRSGGGWHVWVLCDPVDPPTVEEMRRLGRDDLVAQEEREIEVTQRYLPRSLSDEEVMAIVREVVAQTGATGAKDAGKVIGAVMPRVKGVAEGGTVARLVKQVLGGS